MTGWFAVLLAVAVTVGTTGQAEAQSVRDNEREKTKMPSTLRYGSGYVDVPSATVLPHLAITGTYSGWVLNLAEHPQDGDFFGDGSVALGLFDWVEVGGTFQSFNDSDKGGTMAGAFGKIALLRPQRQGIGLAVGARYVSAPSFDDGESTQPTRYGAPHQSLYDGAQGNDVKTEFSPYVAATADVAGLDIGVEHDYTFTIGWGSGMWRDGRQLDFYSNASSSGFFAGAGVHMGLGTNTLLNLMGEWNGFDVNVGAQLDFSGIRVGGFVLGSNYLENKTVPRSAKWGFLVSRSAWLRASRLRSWLPRRAIRSSAPIGCPSGRCGRAWSSPGAMPKAWIGSRMTRTSRSRTRPTRSRVARSASTATTSCASVSTWAFRSSPTATPAARSNRSTLRCARACGSRTRRASRQRGASSPVDLD
jgi:hypothetical protein